SMDPAPLAEAFAVTLGSKTAASPFGGIIGPGLYQFNVEIPDFDGTGGFLPFAIKLASGASTQANVFLAVTRYVQLSRTDVSIPVLMRSSNSPLDLVRRT